MLARSEIVIDLAARIRRIERAGLRPVPVPDDSTSAPASVLSRLLPDVTSLRGRLVEWLSDVKGSGMTSLAVLASQPAIHQELWVIVDGQQTLHAPGLVPLSLDLGRVVLVQPDCFSDALWSVEQALRTRGVGAVVCEIDQLSPAAFRRLQLAAETGGTLGVLLRPERVRHQPSWAEYRFLVRPMATATPLAIRCGGVAPQLPAESRSDSATSLNDAEMSPLKSEIGLRDGKPKRRLLVELLRARGQFTAQSVIVELDDANGCLCVAAELASATTATRAAGA